MKDGGPAYPSASDFTLGGYQTSGHAGMSLRDWFAGQILNGMSGSPEIAKALHQEMADPWAYTASFCYKLADAMLKERDK